VHAIKAAKGIEAEEIAKVEQARISRGADVEVYVAISYFANR